MTTNDVIYLPAFFDRVLSELSTQTLAVHVVPPLYRGQTSLQAAARYYRTFGLKSALSLTLRVLKAKVARKSVARVCRKWNVQCDTVNDVNASDFLARLRKKAPDVLVSVSCPQIFEKPLIQLAPFGCLNVHGSILPQYRGVMPSFWMLANQESQAGVSIYFVDERIDAGGLCGQRVFDIMPDETLDEFLLRSKAVAAELLFEVLKQIESKTVTSSPLNLAEGSYYSWPDSDAVKRFRAAGRRLW